MLSEIYVYLIVIIGAIGFIHTFYALAHCLDDEEGSVLFYITRKNWKELNFFGRIFLILLEMVFCPFNLAILAVLFIISSFFYVLDEIFPKLLFKKTKKSKKE